MDALSDDLRSMVRQELITLAQAAALMPPPSPPAAPPPAAGAAGEEEKAHDPALPLVFDAGGVQVLAEELCGLHEKPCDTQRHEIR